MKDPHSDHSAHIQPHLDSSSHLGDPPPRRAERRVSGRRRGPAEVKRCPISYAQNVPATVPSNAG